MGSAIRKAITTATTRYYETSSGIDPFDIIGLPDFVPRLTRLGVRHVAKAFDQALAAAITERRRSLAADPNAPRDMLGAMLAAKDPQTGEQMTEAEVKDNVTTFIFGGQETTSTTLTWAIYLLSQSPEWRERLIAEAEDAAVGSGHDTEALVQTRAVVEEALAALPAHYRHHADRVATHRARGAYDRTWHDGHHRALRAAPASVAVARPRPVRSVPFPSRPGQGSRAIRLSSFRCGAARVHRRGVRVARGNPRAGDAHAPLSRWTWRPAKRCGRSSISPCGRATACA
jgi:hypothetical protein